MQKTSRKKLTFTFEDRLINSLLNDITVINNSPHTFFVINPVWFGYIIKYDLVDYILNDVVVSWSIKWNKRIFPISRLWR